jgi:hypothetical protein
VFLAENYCKHIILCDWWRTSFNVFRLFNLWLFSPYRYSNFGFGAFCLQQHVLSAIKWRHLFYMNGRWIICGIA